jgi:hypothetical protein
MNSVNREDAAFAQTREGIDNHLSTEGKSDRTVQIHRRSFIFIADPGGPEGGSPFSMGGASRHDINFTFPELEARRIKRGANAARNYFFAAFSVAQRFFCPRAILRRAAALTCRFLLGPDASAAGALVAAATGLCSGPCSALMARSSLSRSAMRRATIELVNMITIVTSAGKAANLVSSSLPRSPLRLRIGLASEEFC